MVLKKSFSINNIYAKTVHKKYSRVPCINYTQLYQLRVWESAESSSNRVRGGALEALA